MRILTLIWLLVLPLGVLAGNEPGTTSNGIPEGSTWMLMLAGGGMWGLLAWFKRDRDA